MRWPGLRASIIGTARATAMIYMVLLGADVLNAGLVLYVLLGCVMDSLAMILLTIPIFYPVVHRAALAGARRLPVAGASQRLNA